MSKSNWSIKDDSGNEFWISRSVVVIPMVVKWVGNRLYILVEKRGEAVPETGKWCCPCGYLDWDETLTQACVREVREETGLVIDEHLVKFVNTNNGVEDNVGMRFICFADPNATFGEIETKDEVEELRWLEIGLAPNNKCIWLDDSKIHSLDAEWAFGHDNLIYEIINTHYPQMGINVMFKQYNM